MQKTNKKEFKIRKEIKRIEDKLYVKLKGYDNWFNSWIDKTNIVQVSEYFPELKSLRRRVKVKLDLSNYATKTDLKNATGVDTSSFDKKADLGNLKSNVDKLDIYKLKNYQFL